MFIIIKPVATEKQPNFNQTEIKLKQIQNKG